MEIHADVGRPASSASDDAAERIPHPLLALVLVNALDTVKKRRRGPSLRRAREWMCMGDVPGRLGFERTCRDLSLDPARVRRRVGLRRARIRDVSRRGFRRGPSA